MDAEDGTDARALPRPAPEPIETPSVQQIDAMIAKNWDECFAVAVEYGRLTREAATAHRARLDEGEQEEILLLPA